MPHIKKYEGMNFLFDFDSTLVKCECLNDILSLALNGNPDKIAEIDEITKNAMNGLITPKTSMEQRLKLATIKKDFVEEIIEKTKNEITDGILKIIKELKKQKNVNIFIISSGFREVIIPIAKILGIDEKNVFANNFIYDENNVVSGVEANILLEEQGKVKIINQLKKDGILIGENIMIGDGFTDLETFLYNAVNNFVCFCGVIERKSVKDKSPNIAMNSKELLNLLEKFSNS